jgi:IclR family transcriptional regulator, KDG regulon repressor
MPKEKTPVKKHAAPAPGGIAVLHKAFDLLDHLQVSEKAESLDALASATGIARSTTHRILRNLIERGYVEKDASGRYHLGLKLLELGATVKTRQTLRDIAYPFMVELRDTFRETVNLGRLQGDCVLYLETVESEQPIRVTGSLGVLDPAHATSIGKAILAFTPPESRPEYRHWKQLTPATASDPRKFARELEEVKQIGYALDDQETMEGGCCIGVPIFKEGRPVAGLSISGPVVRLTQDRRPSIAEALIRTSAEISKRIQLRGTSI